MDGFDSVHSRADAAFAEMDDDRGKSKPGEKVNLRQNVNPVPAGEVQNEAELRAVRASEFAAATPGDTHEEKGANIVGGNRMEGMGALANFENLMGSPSSRESTESVTYDYEKIAQAIPNSFSGEFKSGMISMARNRAQENMNIALQKAVFEAAGVTNRRPTRDLFVQLDNSSTADGIFKASVTLSREQKIEAVKNILR